MGRNAFIEAAPLTKIHLINLIDSASMNLVDAEAVRSVLKQFFEDVDAKIKSGQWTVGNNTDDTAALAALRKLIKASVPNSPSSPRPKGQFPANSTEGARTVTVWSGFAYRNFAAIQLLENDDDFSKKLVPLPPNCSQGDYEYWLQARAQVLIDGVMVADGFEFVKSPQVSVWIAPNSGNVTHSANDLRHKLGLDHLPKTKKAEDQLMVALAFDFTALEGILFRPHMTDAPGHRFRVLTNLDANQHTNVAHGMTVDISNLEFNDGLPELTFELSDDFRPVAQKCWPVGYITVDKSVDEKYHAVFAQHLTRGRNLKDLIATALNGGTP